MTLYILLGVVVVLLVGAVAIYNRLVTNKNMVAEGWSGIDVQLKRRADLIPNLIESGQGLHGPRAGRAGKGHGTPGPEPGGPGGGRQGQGGGGPGRGPGQPLRGGGKLPRLEGLPELPWNCSNPWPTSRTRSSWPGAITTARPAI